MGEGPGVVGTQTRNIKTQTTNTETATQRHSTRLRQVQGCVLESKSNATAKVPHLGSNFRGYRECMIQSHLRMQMVELCVGGGGGTCCFLNGKADVF